MKRFKQMAIILIMIIFSSVYAVAGETGMWSVSYYVDDFGETTDVGYIHNTRLIHGIFSNVAVHNAPLSVCFLIGEAGIAIQLYEYAGTNPVKSFSSDGYTVQVQDKDRNRERFKTTSGTDRLKFRAETSTAISEDGLLEMVYSTHPKWIQDAFLKGGTIKFRITEDGYGSTVYKFEIKNADGYDKAYEKLMNEE